MAALRHEHNKANIARKIGFYTVLQKVEDIRGKQNRFSERYRTELKERRE